MQPKVGAPVDPTYGLLYAVTVMKAGTLLAAGVGIEPTLTGSKPVDIPDVEPAINLAVRTFGLNR